MRPPACARREAGPGWFIPVERSDRGIGRQAGLPSFAIVQGMDLSAAGFWRRALALLVDLVIVGLLRWAGDLLTGLLDDRDPLVRAFDYTYRLVVPAAYFVLMHGTAGQTVGKALVGVRVVDLAGGPIGYPRALGRLAASVLSALVLGLGFLAVLVRRDKRALHDLLASTRVVRAS